MSMCRVFSYVVGRGCLLWPVCSLGKTLLAFALLNFVPQDQGISWFLTFAFQSPVMKRTSRTNIVLEGLVGLHRPIQLQLLQHYWLGHRLGLRWYWMVCLGNELRSFCHFWDCIQYCILDSFVFRTFKKTGKKINITKFQKVEFYFVCLIQLYMHICYFSNYFLL